MFCAPNNKVYLHTTCFRTAKNTIRQMSVLQTISILGHNTPGLTRHIRGRLGASLFIYLFIRRSSEVRAFLLCYLSIAPHISKGDISANAICHLWRLILIDWIEVGLHKLRFAISVVFPVTLTSICCVMSTGS